MGSLCDFRKSKIGGRGRGRSAGLTGSSFSRKPQGAIANQRAIPNRKDQSLPEARVWPRPQGAIANQRAIPNRKDQSLPEARVWPRPLPRASGRRRTRRLVS
jgi:hypothetical protein